MVGGDGDPTKRGVVATASYEAREFGVGSGMPMRTALKKLPDAVFLPVDHAAYDEASAEVMDTLRSLEWGGRPVVVEVLGWDEAFVAAGPRGHRRLGRPGRVRRSAIREQVLAATRLHCSVGIGDNKLRAKIATEFGKPRGSYVLTAETWFEVMGDRPTRALWGIGSKTAKKLAALGIDTVDQLAHSDARMLAAELGPTMGPWYHRIGRGRQRQPGQRRAVGAAGARPGDDVPDRPRGLGPDRRGGPGADPPGGRGHRQARAGRRPGSG